MKKKTFALLLSLVLVFGVIAGGTLAWLTAKSDTVTNTFTTSDIKVELTETNETYKMIPGYKIHKDPAAKVLAGSEECYLFVKLEKSANFDNYLEFTPASGWEQLKTDKDGNAITDLIYYRKVLSADIGTAYSVLANDQVTVKTTVTKEMMNAIDNGTVANPTLTIPAYASQLHKSGTAGEDFTPAQAWANANA